jgi:polyphosphate kinase 2 (PPK2 family)
MIEQIANSSNSKISLKDFDPSDTFGFAKDDIKEEYTKLKERFIELQEVLVASKKFGLLIILQGMDCSGKECTCRSQSKWLCSRKL